MGTLHLEQETGNLAAATVGWVFLFLPILIMSATAYRPERAAETTQGMNRH